MARSVLDNLEITRPELLLSEFDYALPLERIAQTPAEQRDRSRMLVLDRATGRAAAHTVFADIVNYLEPGDLIVLNETRVNALRLFGKLESGARAEFLLTHRIAEGLWQGLAKPGRRLRAGDRVDADGGIQVEVVEVSDERGGRLLRILVGGDSSGADAALEEIGKTPLPPYIHQDDPNRFKERYQTVYAVSPGSAAAPTAGLHFTPDVFRRLADRGVEIAKLTLHVGIGTFRPIESADVREHVMHEEQGEIPRETAEKIAQARGRIVAVGTTSVRALESAAIGNRQVTPGPFRTNLFVTPGYKFRVVDGMVTNFHMPRSTLLVLVSAFAGRDAIAAAYREALDREYRFLSFGDCMLIIDQRQAEPAPGTRETVGFGVSPLDSRIQRIGE